MNPYQEQILDHYKNPRNFGKPKWKATNIVKVQNVSCGDSVELFVLIEDGMIKDIMFDGEGCSIAMAAASLLTEELKGKSVENAQNFKFDDLLEMIGIPLTTSRQRCAFLSYEALAKSLDKRFATDSP